MKIVKVYEFSISFFSNLH